MKDNEHDYFRCTVLRQRPKAYLVKLKHNDAEHWIPMSLCELKCNNGSDEGTLEVEAWFAEKEGMAE